MTIEIDAPLVAHDEEIAGDVVFDLRLNHVWRRFVGGILGRALEDVVWIGTDPEIAQANTWYSELIQDFYTDNGGAGNVNYLGALVGRQITRFLNTTYWTVDFATNSLSPAHDIGGFFDIASPLKLTVPAGGAGYYYCYAQIVRTATSSDVVVRLFDGGTELFAIARLGGSDIATLNLYATRHFDVGDILSLQAKVLSGTVNMGPSNEFQFTATMGMYRVGMG